MRKDFILIFIFLILLPVATGFLIEVLIESIGFRWEVTTYNIVRYLCLFIAIVGCWYILYKNNALKLHSLLWYVLPAITGALLLFLQYTVYSLSHFGF